MQEIMIIIRAGKLEAAIDGERLDVQQLRLEWQAGRPVLLSIVMPPEREAPRGGEYIS